MPHVSKRVSGGHATEDLANARPLDASALGMATRLAASSWPSIAVLLSECEYMFAHHLLNV